MESVKPTVPKKLQSYPLELKLKVVDFAKTASKHKTARVFNIDRRRVIDWCRQEVKLRETILLSRKRVAGGGDKPKWADIDKQLYDWLMEQRANGVNITSKGVQHKALELHKLYGNEAFKASSGWLRRWRKRHSVSFLYRASVTISRKDDKILQDKMANYHHRILNLRMQHQYELHQIGSLSEITIWYNRLEETELPEGIKKDKSWEAIYYRLGLAPGQENDVNLDMNSEKESQMPFRSENGCKPMYYEPDLAPGQGNDSNSEKKSEMPSKKESGSETMHLGLASGHDKDNNSLVNSEVESEMSKNDSEKQSLQKKTLELTENNEIENHLQIENGSFSKTLDTNRLSVILGALASGHKFSPVVIFNGGILPSKDDMPCGVYVRITENGWSNEGELLWWLKTIWTSEIHNHKRRLIICDSFRGNAMDKVEDAMKNIYNTDMAVIPDGCTGIFRPADISWDGVFRRRFHDLYESWLSFSSNEIQIANNKELSRQLLLEWVREAWENVDPKTICSSFKWCGIEDFPTEDISVDMDSLSTDDSDCELEIDIKPIIFPEPTQLSTSLPVKAELEENIGLDNS